MCARGSTSSSFFLSFSGQDSTLYDTVSSSFSPHGLDGGRKLRSLPVHRSRRSGGRIRILPPLDAVVIGGASAAQDTKHYCRGETPTMHLALKYQPLLHRKLTKKADSSL